MFYLFDMEKCKTLRISACFSSSSRCQRACFQDVSSAWFRFSPTPRSPHWAVCCTIGEVLWRYRDTYQQYIILYKPTIISWDRRKYMYIYIIIYIYICIYVFKWLLSGECRDRSALVAAFMREFLRDVVSEKHFCWELRCNSRGFLSPLFRWASTASELISKTTARCICWSLEAGDFGWRQNTEWKIPKVPSDESEWSHQVLCPKAASRVPEPTMVPYEKLSPGRQHVGDFQEWDHRFFGLWKKHQGDHSWLVVSSMAFIFRFIYPLVMSK